MWWAMMLPNQSWCSISFVPHHSSNFSPSLHSPLPHISFPVTNIASFRTVKQVQKAVPTKYHQTPYSVKLWWHIWECAWCDSGGDSFLNLFDSPEGCNIGDWERRCEGEVSAEKAKWNEWWGTKDMEHQDWLGSIIAHHIKFHPSDDFMDISETTHLIQHLTHYDLHSLEVVSHSSLSQVIDQVIFPFISYFSHDESLCFILLLIFFLIFIWFIMLFWDGTLWNIPLTHGWEITYRSQKCCLVIFSWFPPVYKEAVLPQRTIRGLLLAQLSEAQQSWLQHQDLSSLLIKVLTTWITSSECVHITSSSLLQHKVSNIKNIFWRIHWNISYVTLTLKQC